VFEAVVRLVKTEEENTEMKVIKSRNSEISGTELKEDLMAEDKRLAEGNKKRFDANRPVWGFLTPVHGKTGVRREIDQKGPRP
jgi:hypothetical protein